jgi:DNA-binding CsgD family transcriptional regulator
MLSTPSHLPPTTHRGDRDFPNHLGESNPMSLLIEKSFLTEKTKSPGLKVGSKDNPSMFVGFDAESQHCARCLEVASRLSSPRDTATDHEIVEWFRGRKTAARKALSILRPRERQVVMLVAHGYSNKRAAAVLHISERTIEKHRGSACRKLQAQNSIELALLIFAADVLVSPFAADDCEQDLSRKLCEAPGSMSWPDFDLASSVIVELQSNTGRGFQVGSF